ncbi:hypothetical protein [Allomesorhizobium camelthorni]|uniref:Uncharacterized protein n=1 Tax=Allomesorhizobium camelthorni TaxID=475069 RepID=A0A6G4WHE7_9HYPH|nr:hypothetical protein [Mesorhizobium camelthorni]NGO54181.1 hypothetical protein [Mesorhizobium camelthorni]
MSKVGVGSRVEADDLTTGPYDVVVSILSLNGVRDRPVSDERLILARTQEHVSVDRAGRHVEYILAGAISMTLDTVLRLMRTSSPSPSMTAWLMVPLLKKKSFAEPLLVTPCITLDWRLTTRLIPSPVSVMPLLNVPKLSMKLLGPVRLKVPLTAPPARMITEFNSVLVIVRPALNVPWLSTKFLAPVIFAKPLTVLPAKMFSVFWPAPVIVMPPLLITPLWLMTMMPLPDPTMPVLSVPLLVSVLEKPATPLNTTDEGPPLMKPSLLMKLLPVPETLTPLPPTDAPLWTLIVTGVLTGAG